MAEEEEEASSHSIRHNPQGEDGDREDEAAGVEEASADNDVTMMMIDDEFESAAPPKLPDGVVLIARRNQRTHYFLPTKDTTFCGLPCEHVMIDSGCNSILLPFPNEKDRETALKPFLIKFIWTIITTGTTGGGGSTAPILKITNIIDNVGVMKFPTFNNFQANMPFLRFHLGSAKDCRWLLRKYPQKLGPIGRKKLQSYLLDQQRGNDSNNIDNNGARSIALLGQMLLKNYCVVQFGTVMYLMEPSSTTDGMMMNPAIIAAECQRFSDHYLQENYGNGIDQFHNLREPNDNILYDVDGCMLGDDYA